MGQVWFDQGAGTFSQPGQNLGVGATGHKVQSLAACYQSVCLSAVPPSSRSIHINLINTSRTSWCSSVKSSQCGPEACGQKANERR